MTDGLATTVVGSGPRVVLVHGFTQTAGSWSAIAADLSRDHEVVSVDAPGHGASGDLDVDLWGAADALAVAGGRATYVGYSMGGRIALHLALRHPDLVERLVVLGATGGIDDDAERAARREADNTLAARIEALGVEEFLDEWLAQPLFAGVPDDRADRLINTAAGLASSLRRCGTGTQEPLWGALRALQMPVLVLHGERDAKFAELARRLVVCIGSNATVASVPGAGHAAHLERPAEFIDLLRTWLPA